MRYTLVFYLSFAFALWPSGKPLSRLLAPRAAAFPGSAAR